MTSDADTDYIIETRGLTKEFSGFISVNNLDLRVRSGTIHALIGPNGAGKTTIFNLITKFLAPTSGQIFYGGIDVTGFSPSLLAQRGMVRSFQISAVFPSLSVRDNVRIALQRSTGLTYRFWQSEVRLYGLHDRVQELLASVGLQDFADVIAGDLSYGRKRALEIATTIALEPRLLLLDEPTAGLGQEDIDTIVRLIKNFAVNRSVLMVEHNLSVVEDLSDAITVLSRGKILAEGTYQTVSKNREVMEAYLGTGDDDPP